MTEEQPMPYGEALARLTDFEAAVASGQFEWIPEAELMPGAVRGIRRVKESPA